MAKSGISLESLEQKNTPGSTPGVFFCLAVTRLVYNKLDAS